jgi:hypothetical protein
MSAATGSARATLVAEGRLPWRRRRQLSRALPVSPPVAGRYRYVHDVTGPKVRIGIAWFVVLLAACGPGPPPWALAALLAAVAGVAAAQTARAHVAASTAAPRRSLLPFVAGLAATGVAAASAAGPRVLGAAILLAVATTAAAVAAGLVPVVPRALQPGPVGVEASRAASGGLAGQLDAVGTGVRCWLFVALAAAAPVLLARAEVGRTIVLLFLAAAYDVGDYLVGSASANAIEGPLAGIIGVVVMTFAAAVVDPPGFDGGVWAFGLLAAVLCPLGPLAASAILPRAAAFAPALRRLDSLLLVGPVWLLGWH